MIIRYLLLLIVQADDYEIDERLENGPLQDRRCTDIICWIIFIVFAAAVVAISIYGYFNGNPYKLFSGLDGDGNFCGYSSGYENYKYLYFWKVDTTDLWSYAVCVSECPTSNSTSIDCMTTSYVSDCNSNATYYDTYSFIGMYCLPTYEALSTFDSSVYDSFISILETLNSFTTYITDIAYAWEVYLIVVVSGLIFLTIYGFFIKFCSGLLVWVPNLLILLLLIGFGFYVYDYACNNYVDGESTQTILKIAAYVIWGLAALHVLMILCSMKSMK